MTAGLLQLLQAYAFTEELKRPVWDFAVEIENLRVAGLTTTDLRWLVCKGYVEHAIETTPPGSETRTYERESRLTFSQGSCFVLTESGAELAREAGRVADGSAENNGTSTNGNGTALPIRPQWDPECRTLRVGDRVVKQFRVPAGNQELILAAFEEMNWPPHIDDPLPPVHGLDPKQRLRDAISRLNHNQKQQLIRFHGDGQRPRSALGHAGVNRPRSANKAPVALRSPRAMIEHGKTRRQFMLPPLQRRKHELTPSFAGSATPREARG